MARVSWVGALVALGVACGGQPGITAEGSRCQAATCASLGATCGAVPDGCGGTLECGGCPSGQSCGGGGTPNACGGTSSCQPATCAALGKTCGDVPDLCGGTLDCGGCPPGRACGAGGVPNVCGDACAPTTCAAAGKTCGTIPDGCGGTLGCGECPAGQGCGVGGTPNVCAPRTASVAWASLVRGARWAADRVLSVGSDAAGRRYALSTVDEVWTSEGNAGVLRLQRLDASGALLSTRDWSFVGSPYASRIAISPSGDVYLAITGATGTAVDFGDVEVAGPALVKLASGETVEWQLPLSNDVQSIAAATTGVVLLTFSPESVLRIAADGSTTWARALWLGGATCTAARSGDAICAEALTWADPAATRISRFAAADGSTVWVRDVTGLAGGWSIRTGGDVVALSGSRRGNVELGTDRITSGDSVLLALHADGTPRWARAVDGGWPTGNLAVDPRGRTVLDVQPPSCSGHLLSAWEADGAPSWTARLPTDGTCSAGPFLREIDAGADGDLFVGGELWTAVMIGSTRFVPEGSDAFYALLAAP